MLALIAGQGALPAAVSAACAVPPVVAALEGFWPQGLTPEPDLVWRVETMGTLLARLQARGVTEVCLCGAVERPSVDMGAIDDATLPLIPAMRDALATKGDDGVLRAVIGIFESAGFKVRAAHEVAPALLPPEGVLTEAQPGPEANDEARLGDAVSAEQGARDLGQACVIRDGGVIALETAEGTNAMLAGLPARGANDDLVTATLDGVGDMLGAAADWLSGVPAQGQGMFYKAPKPGQDHRADLPVIGPETVHAVAAAGLAGLVIRTGGVMVLDQGQTLALCARHGLYLWVRTP
ncbi:LpxI family protein [Roseobacteraceae bacterium S113]